MHGWMEACMHGWMDAQIDGWMAGSMDGWMGGQVDGQMHRLMDEWMDGWMDLWMDGWMDGQMYVGISMTNVKKINCKVQIFEMRLMLRESVNWELQSLIFIFSVWNTGYTECKLCWVVFKRSL